MSKLSFNAFCIEMYAEHSGMASPDAYLAFDSAGLMDLLDADYEDLHGMSWESLMQMFDEYLAGGGSKEAGRA